MPTENRSSNTEMVSELLPCPFCGETPQITKHHREDIYSFMHRCQVLGPISWGFREDQQAHIETWNARTTPAEQRHGEPVTWEAAEHISNLPAVHEVLQLFSEDPTGDAGTSLVREVLNSAHTDPGEVERLRYKAELYDEVWELVTGLGYMNVTTAVSELRAELAKMTIFRDNAASHMTRIRSEATAFAKERDELRAQLTERDALPQKLKETLQREYWDEYAGLDETRELIDAALSASQEASTPAAQYPNRLCHIDYTAHPYRCGCLNGDEEAQRIHDEHCRRPTAEPETKS